MQAPYAHRCGPLLPVGVISFLAVTALVSQSIAVPLAMCGPDGQCREEPSTPSPRTRYTAKTSALQSAWTRFHEELARRAAAYAPTQKPLLLLGDSITEAWLGTSMNEDSERARGCPDVLAQKFPDYSPLVLAISGDQTQHLLWRLQNGEWPSAIPSATVVVMIGTNNLGRGHLPGETARGVMAVASDVLMRLDGASKLLVLGLLPRGDGSRLLKRLCPPRCDKQGAPYASFMPAVSKVNSDVQQAVSDLHDQRVVFADCGAAFLDAAGAVRERLMPDRLHPNAEGLGLLADCIRSTLSYTFVTDPEQASRQGFSTQAAVSTGGGGGEGSPPSSRSSRSTSPFARAACRTQLSSTRHEFAHSFLNKWASLR